MSLISLWTAVSPSPMPIAAAPEITHVQKLCGVTDTLAISEEQAKCISDATLAGDSIWIVIIKAVLVLVFLLL
jgi:hypothetical protein